MMTKNRAAKAATRKRMTETAEPYTLAQRGNSIEQVKVEAWLDEYETLVVYGTHNPTAAMLAVRKVAPEWLDPSDLAYDELLTDESFYRIMNRYWTRPLPVEEEFLDKLAEPGPGLVPYMYITLS